MKHLPWLLLPWLVACNSSSSNDGDPSSPMSNGGSAVGGSSSGAGASAAGTGAGGIPDPGVAVLPGGVKLEGKPGFYRVVRITHAQWENAAREVLQMPQVSGLSSGFSPDPPNGKFDNNERALYVSSTLWTDYQRAAEKLADEVVKDAAALARLGSAADSAGFVRKLGHAAYRRPLRADEEQRFTKLFAAGPTVVGSGDAFVDGARVVIEALLQSPNFLYRVELTAKGERLSGNELATKLSLLLRDTIPDSALLQSAEQGDLADADKLNKFVEELLADDAARAVVQRFHSELFGLPRYSSIAKDKSLFPTYKESLNSTLLEADYKFFDRIFEAGQTFRDILKSPLAFVNAESAPLYGVTATGDALSEIMLGEGRPGFLTRLGFLAQNATLRDPDPIHRGVDISRRILCVTLNPPPGMIPPLPAFVEGQTNRERVVGHTSQGVCGGCHNSLINPLGFAFEGFDALGQTRTMDNGKPIDAAAEYTFGDVKKSFDGAVELTNLLAESEQAHGCYSANLTEFAFTRDLAGGDGDVVTALQSGSIKDKRSVKDTLLSILTSKEFTTALGGAP